MAGGGRGAARWRSAHEHAIDLRQDGRKSTGEPLGTLTPSRVGKGTGRGNPARPSVLGKVSRCHCPRGGICAQQGLTAGTDTAGQNLSGLFLGSMPVFCFHQSLKEI